MYRPGYFEDDPMLNPALSSLSRRGGAAPRRFDEYYRCYPVVMLPGPERANVNYGGKVILPPSALDKLTRLHISYPMMFELINGARDTLTHAGVLEFIAEEGKIYLPYWLMQTLAVEAGDLLQVKSTDLPSGSYIKLQAQSTSFLDISDPKAVLETVLRDYSCLTTGDVFTFAYNDQTFDMAVLETKPASDKKAIVVLETDLEVDFAAPVGYEDPPKRPSGTSTPASSVAGSLPAGGTLHPHGTMAQAINYASIAPSSTSAAAGARAASSHFTAGGHKLASASRKASATATPKTHTPPTSSTPVGGMSANPLQPTAAQKRRTNGPQPLRLPPGKLFFGYEIKAVRKNGPDGEALPDDEKEVKFKGQGQTLRTGKKKAPPAAAADKSETEKSESSGGASGIGGGGRTLRDSKKRD